MDPDAITRYITDTFDGVDVVVASGNSFFFSNPADHRFPFATLVTNDDYDQASNLSRPSVYRLNVGVSPQTYRLLFGPETDPSAPDGDAGGYDFTTLDRIMPHPVYGAQFWVCVLSPSPATFETVRPLLAEAHARAARRRGKAKSVDEA